MRSAFVSRWRATGIVALAVLLLITLRPVSAQDGAPEDLTFEGPTEAGGTISLTVTEDRTGITRVGLQNVSLDGKYCSPEPISEVSYYDPPVPITDGEFLFSLRGHVSVHQSWHVGFEGAFVSDIQVAGTAWYSSLPCETGPEIVWNLEGPVDTPPGPDDLVFFGTVGRGSITLTADSLGGGVTSLVLDQVSVRPCTEKDNPLDVRAFFEPPAPVVPPEESFRVRFLLGGAEAPAAVTVSGAFVDEDTVEGTLLMSLLLSCSGEKSWSAQAIFDATATTSPAAPATAVPLSQLPATGTGGGQTAVTPVVVLALGAAFLGAAAFARKRT